jgi:hypothetical protein
MGGVRRYGEDDAGRVLELHEKVFRQKGQASRAKHDALKFHYSTALFQYPWRDEEIQSLVYEADDGNVVAFVGAMPRPMFFEDTPIRAAVFWSFMVDPAVRSPTPAVSLLMESLRGPQDLTIGNGANDEMRRIWETIGNVVLPLQSIQWWRAFRPCSFYLGRITRGNTFPRKLVSYFGRVPCTLIDFVAARVPGSPTRATEPPAVSGMPLKTRELIHYIERASHGMKVRPAYDERSLQWVLDYLGSTYRAGGLARTAVVDKDGDVLGWYVFRVTSNRVYDVLQVGSVKGSVDLVLKQLFARAAKDGASLVQGLLDAPTLKVVSDNNCMLKRGPWSLVHSKDPKILDALTSGNGFISRLETSCLP